MPTGVLADLALPPFVPFLNWAWDDLLFLLLAGIMLAAAIFVVVGRNIVRSGVAMMLCFAALAGIYVLAGAVIVAAAQVLIYIGAISILVLFAIMLTQSKSGPLSLVFHRQAWAGLLAAIGVVVLLVISVVNTEWPLAVADRLWSVTDEVPSSSRVVTSTGMSPATSMTSFPVPPITLVATPNPVPTTPKLSSPSRPSISSDSIRA